MARVFLSHAGPDKPVVRRIAAALRAAGHDPWLDEDDILVGESIPSAVERGLHEADFVVLCLSKAAAERGWVEAERDATMMQQFRERKERILPVRLEEVTPPRLVRPLAHVDLFPDEQAFHRGIARLTSSIAAYTARRAMKGGATALNAQTTTDTLATTGAAPPGRPMARNGAQPTPVYLNAEVQALSEQLERARQRKQSLRGAGIVTREVDREILELRRKLRDGGQLRAGDALGDGRYLLVNPVGRGGFAVVWEAFDRAEQRRVAIKVLHHHLASDPQRRERFFRGARVMMDLNHPAVVRVLDPRGEDESFCYFVMELAPGGNLRDAVLGHRVDVGHRLALILQVGEALAEAHRQRLVHRDIKPANILLDEHGNAKLTDFDLVGAHDTTGGTRTGALGTVVYAAPECLDKPQEATARADVFGLGMTAIFCLSGQELSLATFRNPAATVARLDCSVPVRKVLERAVAWEPSERFADAAEMVGALRDALDDSSPSAIADAAGAVSTPARGGEPERPLVAIRDPLVPSVQRRTTLPWLAGAVAAGFTAIIAAVVENNSFDETNRAAATTLSTDVERLAAAFDTAARSAHMRADGVATTPMLRQAIETDAATLSDMANTEMVFAADRGEALEVFQFRGERSTSLLRIPRTALSVQPLKGRATRFQSDGKGVTLAASAPISAYRSGVAGGLVISAPVDLTAIRHSFSDHAVYASLKGLGPDVNLAGSMDNASSVPIKFMVPSSGDWNAGNTAVIAIPRPAAHRELVYVRNIFGVLCALLLAGFIVSIARRRP